MDLYDIVEQVDIVDYISQYVDLEEKNGEFWGLSPFTNEKTPSFSVNREKKVFKDFSSGLGGNVITFIKNYHRCDSKRAIEILKQHAGIDENTLVAYSRLSATKIINQYKNRDKSLSLNNFTPLPNDILDLYEFDINKLKPWINEGITIETLKEFGVKYDRVNNAIVYPIHSIDGTLINLGFRTLIEDYKDRGIPKYIYKQPIRKTGLIYGLDKAKEEMQKKQQLIIFEGAKSVMKAWQWGYKNCCAILTSHLSKEQLLRLIMLQLKEIVVAVDSDINIYQDVNFKKLKKYTNVTWVSNKYNLLDYKDSPVDKGKDVFNLLYSERRKL